MGDTMGRVKGSVLFMNIIKKFGSKMGRAFKGLVSDENPGDIEEPDMSIPEVKKFFETAERLDEKSKNKSSKSSLYQVDPEMIKAAERVTDSSKMKKQQEKSGRDITD
jgi:hypothetical protein